MNKKAGIEIDKTLILILALLALILFFILIKNSLTNSIDSFFNLIKGIFK